MALSRIETALRWTMVSELSLEQQHLDLSKRFYEEYLMGGTDILDELVSPEFSGHGFGGHEGELFGADGLRTYFGETIGTRHYDIQDHFAADDRVVTRWTVHTPDDIVRGGPSPTGGETEMPGITIERYENGKLAEMWVQADYLYMYRQLDLVEEPEE